MKKIILTIIFLLNITLSKSALVVSPSVVSATLAASCLVKYVNDVADGETIFISKDEGRLEEISDFTVEQFVKHGSRMNSIEIHTCVTRRNCRGKTLPYQQYLIFANSSDRLRFVLEECLCSEYSPEAKFMIIANETGDLSKMIDLIKVNRLYTGLIVTSLNDNDIIFNYVKSRCREMDISNQTFNYSCLFSDTKQKPHFDKEILTKCRFIVGIRYAFPYTQRPDDPVRYAYRHYAGIELYTLADILPSRSNPYDISDEHELGSYYPENKTATGLFGELFDGDVDLIVGALHFDDKYPFIEPSHPIVYAKLISVVKKRKDVRLLRLLRVFDWRIWLLMFIFVLIFILVKYILMIYHHDRSFEIQSTLFNIYAILIEQDADLRKRYLRLAILSWIWIAFIFRTTYEAYSTLLFMAKDSSDQVDTLHQICSENFTVFVRDINYPYFRNGYEVSGCFIPPENFVVVENPQTQLLKVKSDSVAAFMYNRMYHPKIETSAEDGSSPFHITKEIIHIVPLVYYFRAGDPLVGVFRKQILLLEQSSLVQKFQRRMDVLLALEEAAVHRTIERKLSLSLDHVIVAFYLGLFGVVLSVTVFILEFITFKCTKWHRIKSY